jgi:amino acid adenylation domain-containing protein
MAPVPVGVRGELYAGGAAVPRCYGNDPVATAAKIVPDPFSGAPGGRLYRTGDAARHLASGVIEHLGRLDGQVKVRGFRVELGEVETVLARHPSVADAAVVAVPDAAAGHRLIAYLVTGGGASPAPLAPLTPQTLEALRAHLRHHLPEFMVPAAFVALDELPLSANGKLDTAALPAPADPAGGNGEADASGTPAEEILAGIWEQVLGRRPGAADGFFALGGHSLLATQVTSRVREAFGVELPLRALFESPTLAGLALEVERLLGEREGGAPPPLSAATPEQAAIPAPLSFAQRRLWFLDRFEPGSSAYNMPLPVRLAGRLTRIAGRHDALRTTFAERGGEPVQQVAPAAELPLPAIDLTVLPAARRETEARRLLTLEADRPFDLAAGPLVRAFLLRLAAEEHAALLTLHHIVSDGWSLGVLMREMGEAYAAEAAGQPPALAPLPVQYTDFSRWQRAWLDGPVLERELDFWRQALAGSAPFLALPTDRPRPAVRSEAGGSRPLALGPAVLARVRRAARDGGATVFMALLAGFTAVLARHAREERFAVGSPIAGRNRLETEGLIGFFVNTLALPADLTGDPGFGTLLPRVRRATLAAYAHQDVPFERLVEELAPERSLAWSPIFQVLFALQNAPMPPLELPGLTLAPFAIERRTAQFDLSLSLWETEDGFLGEIEHNRDLFDGTTVDRLGRQLGELLQRALDEPERPLSEISLLAAEERHQLLAEWNDAAADFAGTAGAALADLRTVPEILAGWAAATPGSPALRLDGAALSYGELWRRARRLAGRLADLGVGPETAVAVCLPRSLEGVVAFCGVLASGGFFVPLDPAAPLQRLAFALADSGAGVMVTRRSLLSAAGIDAADLEVALLDVDELQDPEAAGEEGRAALPAPWPDSLAYAIYTSGSTGIPKGVAVPHAALAAHLATVRDLFQLGPDDGVLQFSSWSFDAAIEQLFGALSAGATAVLRGPGLWGLEELLPRLARQGVTVADLPTAYWQRWVLDRGREAAPAGLRLRLVLPGGEAMSAEPARRFPETAAGGARLLNCYGPTEAVITAAGYFVPPGEPLGGATVPIGRPLAGRAAYVLGPSGRLQPLGGAGELALGGLLARGYLGRPELTAERFVPDPWGPAGARLYRSGDLVRYLAGGDLEFLGRIDRQVKLRGFRIELGEVEAALLAQPGVREAAVVVAGPEGSLAAYVSPEGVEIEALKGALHDRLPDFMVPSLWRALPELPKTPTGKLDRRSLPAIVVGGGSGPIELPRTPLEQLMADLWRDLLGAERVGRHDDFFALGGHSLLAVQLTSRLRDILEVELPVRAVFETPTLAGLAAAAGKELSRLAGDDLLDELLGEADDE